MPRRPVWKWGPGSLGLQLEKLRDETAFDTETTGLHPHHGDRPYAFAWCDEHGNEAYLAVPVDPYTREVEYDDDDIVSMRQWFGDPRRHVVGHNIKFDFHHLEGIGVERACVVNETMAAVHVVRGPNPNLKLKPLALRYCQFPDDDEKELRKATAAARRAGKKHGYRVTGDDANDPIAPDMWLCDPDRGGGPLVKKYGVGDVQRNILLWLLFKDLMEEHAVRDTYDREMALWPVTFAMERRGVRTRTKYIRQEIASGEERAAALKVEFDKMCPPGLNVRSGKQMGVFMHSPVEEGGLGLPVKKRTKTGKPATDAETLQAYDHPFLNTLITHRQIRKTIDTYLQVYLDQSRPDHVDPRVRSLHPNFNQIGPITGRYSSSGPNMQNVGNPQATNSMGAVAVRGAFGPRPGMVWLLPDWSQLEVRIFADKAQERIMLRAIANGRDIHTECTNYAWGGRGNMNGVRQSVHSLEMEPHFEFERSSDLIQAARDEFGWCGDPHCLDGCGPMTVAERYLAASNWDIVLAEKGIGRKNTRACAKQLLFLKIYGGGATRAAEFFGGDIVAARKFIGQYDRSFPAIKKYAKTLSRQAVEDGCIRNAYNRRVAVDPNLSYRCVNYMIQGSAADLLKDRMLALHRFFAETGMDAHLVMTIHDEVVIEIAHEQATTWNLCRIRDVMEDHGGVFNVPLPIDMDVVTTRWDQKVEVKLPRRRQVA